MIVLFSDDETLFETVELAIDRAVPVRRETDAQSYLSSSDNPFHHPTAIIVDCRCDSYPPLEVIDRVLQQLRSVPVLAVVDSSDTEMAYEVGDRGIAGWIPAPFHSQLIRERLLNALGRRDFFGEVHEAPIQLQEQIIGGSRVLAELRRTVVKAANCRFNVLVAGETGSGKELVAQGIHALSRASGPFITANMSAVAPALFESELFGSRSGAFTGARDKDGLFQAAHNGTLFLDEISEMALELQPKLLRAVERKEVRPVGSTASIPINVRIVSATNRNLTVIRRTGGIRRDLWHRLMEMVIHVPPLRERLEDIPA
ncbi:MAG TPA: sigma 54-interacting transcriptional regulator, partial [Alkalispirochaeta sp.]|nr:sigma 54-interacting transcriptional regulator [Alkalispirochaeta sp.]